MKTHLGISGPGPCAFLFATLIAIAPRASAQNVIVGLDVSGFGGNGIGGSCDLAHTPIGVALGGEAPVHRVLSVRATARLHLFEIGPYCVTDAVALSPAYRTLRTDNLVDSKYVATDAVLRLTPWPNGTGINFGVGGGYVWRDARNIPYLLLTGEFAFGGPAGTRLALTSGLYQMHMRFRELEFTGPLGFGGPVRLIDERNEWRTGWSFGLDVTIPVFGRR